MIFFLSSCDFSYGYWNFVVIGV